MLEASSSSRSSAPQPGSSARLAPWRPGLGLALVGAAWGLCLALACAPGAPLALGLGLQAPLLAVHTLAHALAAATQRDALARGFVALHGALGRPRRVSHLVVVGGALLSICVGAAAAGQGGLEGAGAARTVLACLTGAQGVCALACSALALRRVLAHNRALEQGVQGDAAAFLGAADGGLSVCEAQARMIEVLREERARMRRDLGLEGRGAERGDGGAEARARALSSTREALAGEVLALGREEEALRARVAGLRAELLALHPAV